jgi:hypothetical protein
VRQWVEAERGATNNHAIYYDLQLSEYALFSGNAAPWPRKSWANFRREAAGEH